MIEELEHEADLVDESLVVVRRIPGLLADVDHVVVPLAQPLDAGAAEAARYSSGISSSVPPKSAWSCAVMNAG